MIALLQRSRNASVSIAGESVARIRFGLVVLVGFRRGDEPEQIDRFVERILNYRVFPDETGRMNRSLRDVDGELLAVPQFTLAADTNSGNRPSFTPAASPEDGRELFAKFQTGMSSAWAASQFGVFGADMQVALVNDGPVTFWLEV